MEKYAGSRIARRFPEQEHIANFEQMDFIQRRAAMEIERKNSLIKAATLKTGDRKSQPGRFHLRQIFG